MGGMTKIPVYIKIWLKKQYKTLHTTNGNKLLI